MGRAGGELFQHPALASVEAKPELPWKVCKTKQKNPTNPKPPKPKQKNPSATLLVHETQKMKWDYKQMKYVSVGHQHRL